MSNPWLMANTRPDEVKRVVAEPNKTLKDLQHPIAVDLKLRAHRMATRAASPAANEGIAPGKPLEFPAAEIRFCTLGPR